MNIDEIKTAVLAYSDREDEDVKKSLNTFLAVTEARLNKILRVRQQFNRAAMLVSIDQEYYGLPDDFAELRDIEVKTHVSSTDRFTPRYLSPEQMNDHITAQSSIPSYTIIADMLQLYPTSDEWVVEVVYASKVPALTDKTPTNWLSISSPSSYIFGMMVELSAYIKDGEAASLWDTRFKEDIAQIVHQDDIGRWSGTSLQIRTQQ